LSTILSTTRGSLPRQISTASGRRASAFACSYLVSREVLCKVHGCLLYLEFFERYKAVMAEGQALRSSDPGLLTWPTTHTFAFRGCTSTNPTRRQCSLCLVAKQDKEQMHLCIEDAQISISRRTNGRSPCLASREEKDFSRPGKRILHGCAKAHN
jgi:hypothetical protein